jgi:hypothetical protein
MTEVHKVTIEIKKPKGNFPGQVAFGYFTYVDGVVTLTDPKGVPADDGNGRRYIQRGIAPGHERNVACNLTRQLRDALRGSSPSGLKADFSGPIEYPRSWRGV